MIHANTSSWYDSLSQELERSSTSIEKVSRRSEYWRKSNLDIVSDLDQEVSETDLINLKGTHLYEPELTIDGDVMELASDKSYEISNIMNEIADEDSFIKNYFGRLLLKQSNGNQICSRE